MFVSSTNVRERCCREDIQEERVEGFWSSLQLLFTRGELCDATIVCSDGMSLKAHKIILASYSQYFRTLFSKTMLEDTGMDDCIYLQFSSASVRMFLDVIYQVDADVSYDVDVVDFWMLLDFLVLNHTYLSTHLKCFPSQHLTLDNCIEELNKAISLKSDSCPWWVQAIMHYIFQRFELGVEDRSKISIQQMSRESLASLINSVYFKFSSLDLLAALLSHIMKLNEIVDNSVLLKFCAISSSIIEEYSCDKPSRCELINKITILQGKIIQNRKLYSHQELSFDSLEEVVIGIETGPDYNDRTVVNFFFSVGKWKFVCDSKGTSGVYDSVDELSDQVKFFSKFNSIYAICFNKRKQNIHLMQYDGEYFFWSSIAETNALYQDVHIYSCLPLEDQILVSCNGFLLIFELSTRPLGTRIIDVENLFVKKIVKESEIIVFLESPYLAMTLIDEIQHLHQIVHSKADISRSCFVVYLGKTFNIYNCRSEEGIFIDQFNFKEFKWIEQKNKLLEGGGTVKDTFVANGKLFVTYQISEVSCNEKEEVVNELVIIRHCSYEKSTCGRITFRLAESPVLKVKPSDYGSHIEFLIARKDLFLYDDLKVFP